MIISFNSLVIDYLGQERATRLGEANQNVTPLGQPFRVNEVSNSPTKNP